MVFLVFTVSGRYSTAVYCVVSVTKALPIGRKLTMVSMVFAVSGRYSTAVYCVLSDKFRHPRQDGS